jgi:hypothetical protein
MDKLIGGSLQVGAAFMFFAAGAFGGDAVLLLLPAALSGVAGVHLWSRGARLSLPPAKEPAQLERQVAQVQDSLESLHAEVRQLREGKEFYGQLYPSGNGQAPSHPSGSRSALYPASDLD